jgi:hypothetical protein
LTGNEQPVDLDVNEGFFQDLDSALTSVTVKSWKEPVSANESHLALKFSLLRRERNGQSKIKKAVSLL